MIQLLAKRSLCSVRFVEPMIMENVTWIKSSEKIFRKNFATLAASYFTLSRLVFRLSSS